MCKERDGVYYLLGSELTQLRISEWQHCHTEAEIHFPTRVSNNLPIKDFVAFEENAFELGKLSDLDLSELELIAEIVSLTIKRKKLPVVAFVPEQKPLIKQRRLIDGQIELLYERLDCKHLPTLTKIFDRLPKPD